MNPQDKETKLRKAAGIHWMDILKNALDKTATHTLVDLERYCKEDFITGAKSEAAREYHQQEPKEVTVPTDSEIETLSLQGRDQRFVDPCNQSGWIEGAKAMRDILKPHLQPKQESDAVDPVEFAEWTSANGWKFVKEVGNNGMWRNENGIVIMEWPTPPLYITGEKLKAEFKQSKTNSDEGK